MINIPANNTTQKDFIKTLVQSTKLLDSSCKKVQPFRAFIYAQNQYLYVSNGIVLIELKPDFDIGPGFYSLVKTGKDYKLIPENIDAIYPEVSQLLDTSKMVGIPTPDYVEQPYILYCNIIHALSIGCRYCFDPKYLDCVPRVITGFFIEKNHSQRSPFILETDNFKIVIMPVVL